jgi:GT2 family glycosyltransferase
MKNPTQIINYIIKEILIKCSDLRKTIIPDGSRRKSLCKGILNLARNPRGVINDLKFKANITFRSLRGSNTFPESNRYDVIFFSFIEWGFRYQRPQHIASRFAKNGHRIFYINVHLRNKASYRKSLISENIYNIFLPFNKNTTIYNIDIGNEFETLASAFDSIFRDFRIKESVAFVEFPLWYPVVNYLKHKYDTKVVFDCLDEFSGFKNIHTDIKQVEDELLMSSDFCLSTSLKLFEKHKDRCSNISVVRNATEFEHFHNLPHNNLLKDIKKPVIGYYGAIAEWFDTETIEYLLSRRPDWNILLIGKTHGSDVNRLKRKYKNIYILGEKPYNELPKFLYWFDVCIIPFKLNDLITSTNPVKFYEYISSGKPVVSSEVPELLQYSDLLYLSRDKEEFLENINKALQENDQNLIQRRIELAKANDWDSRFIEISNCIKTAFPLVSVVIVTFNNLKYTKLCAESIYAKTAYPNFELIIVDNASTDETQDYLKHLKNQHDNIKIILNKENLGFASANNMGIKESKGRYVILLNNDTIVTKGWMNGLIKHLRSPKVGLVGPVTNSIGNEAKINTDYDNLSEMEEFAEQYTETNRDRIFEIPVLAMYCLALNRATIEKIGYLDEQFSIGMFEDDDYALRIKKAGLKIICAENVFIHHFGGASFSKLESSEYRTIFNENKLKYEDKWDREWVPHTYRDGVK